MKFKIGDTVRIISKEKLLNTPSYDKNTGMGFIEDWYDWTFNSSMRALCGKQVTISEIKENNRRVTYLLAEEGNSGHHWVTECFDLDPITLLIIQIDKELSE